MSDRKALAREIAADYTTLHRDQERGVAPDSWSERNAQCRERAKATCASAGPLRREIESISLSADRPLKHVSQLICFYREAPNRLKPNAMQKCYICGKPWREINNEGTRLTGCLNCNFWTARDGKEWRRLSVDHLDALRRRRTGTAGPEQKNPGLSLTRRSRPLAPSRRRASKQASRTRGARCRKRAPPEADAPGT